MSPTKNNTPHSEESHPEEPTPEASNESKPQPTQEIPEQAKPDPNTPPVLRYVSGFGFLTAEKKAELYRGVGLSQKQLRQLKSAGVSLPGSTTDELQNPPPKKTRSSKPTQPPGPSQQKTTTPSPATQLPPPPPQPPAPPIPPIQPPIQPQFQLQPQPLPFPGKVITDSRPNALAYAQHASTTPSPDPHHLILWSDASFVKDETTPSSFAVVHRLHTSVSSPPHMARPRLHHLPILARPTILHRTHRHRMARSPSP